MGIVSWWWQRAGSVSRSTEALFKPVIANILLTKATWLSSESDWEDTEQLHAKNVATRKEGELGPLMQSVYCRIMTFK